MYIGNGNLEERVATKTFKLGKYTITKGTRFNLLVSAFHLNPRVYANPNKVDLRRFARKPDAPNIKKSISYMPFSLGQRICVGRYLAELVVQMILVAFVKSFEFTAPESHEVGAIEGLSYGPDSFFLQLKPKKKQTDSTK